MSLRCGNAENGLRVGTDGKFYACCLAWEYPYTNEKGQILKADTTKFKDALNSHSANELKEALRRGEKHPACRICWEAEEAGFESKRIRDTHFSDHAKESDDQLFFLELNLGNTCNLACRMCGIHASSSWRKDFHLLNSELTDKEVNDRLREFNKVFVDYSKLWDELESTIAQVKVLDLYGGEPMLMKKQWELLEKCVEKGFSKNQHVHFNTNGTIFDEKYIEILKHFKEVRISFSADGTDKVFNYIRHLGDWNEVQENIKKWLAHTKEHRHFTYEITFTTSTLNVIHANAIGEWVLDHNLATEKTGDHIITLYVAFVFAPEIHYIGNIHDDLKPTISKIVRDRAEKLKAHPAYERHQYVVNEILKIAQTIDNSDPCKRKIWEKLFFDNSKLDRFRDQKFSEVSPELFRLYSEYEPNGGYVKLL